MTFSVSAEARICQYRRDRMSDLTEVLAWSDQAVALIRNDYPDASQLVGSLLVLQGVARRWDVFPTDEDVEAVVRAMWDCHIEAMASAPGSALDPADWSWESMGPRKHDLRAGARAALEAVRARETGETNG